MVPFAGYEMPVQYEGIIAEHLWTRENAGLFDVSHMGQLLVHGRGADEALEKMMPGDLQAAADMKPKYSLLLNDEGGIVDDLMATRRGEDFYIVVNGATKHGDIADMERRLPGEVVIDHMKQQALLALQGPRAAEVLETIVPGVSSLGFMQGGPFQWQDRKLWISRSGYTGEDGFEISVPAVAAADLADAIAGHINGQADWAGCARFAAAGSRASALRSRPRSSHHAGNGGAHLRDQQAPPHRWRIRRSDANPR